MTEHNLECKLMKGLGETLPFHRITNPWHDKSVYIWLERVYLLILLQVFGHELHVLILSPKLKFADFNTLYIDNLAFRL